MAWSNKQKQIFARACAAAKLTADQRHMILMQCDQRAMHLGKATSTSPKLTNEDFEWCMAVAEKMCGGQVPFNGYSPGYWQTKADEGPLGRRIYRIRQIVMQLSVIDGSWLDLERRLLEWIHHSNILPAGTAIAKLGQLDYLQLGQVIDGLTAYAKRHGAAVGRAA